jgi:hypothetical protein
MALADTRIVSATASIAGTITLAPCPANFANPGCIAVFAPVPEAEPARLPILVVGLRGLMGLAVRRRPQKLA